VIPLDNRSGRSAQTAQDGDNRIEIVWT
jgi:hypothetical protein